MQILITSAAAPLAQALAGSLSDQHAVRLTEVVEVPGPHDFVQAALDHGAETDQLVQGVDAIVHVAEPLPGQSANQQIDALTRRTYNLLWAAAAAGVKRVVYLSTLDLMTAYPAEYTVTERWRPRPSTEPRSLAKHLGESVCREFAREAKFSATTVLRLGRVVLADRLQGAPVDPLWVDQRDLIQAVDQALTVSLPVWSIFHIQADSPQGRFSVAHAAATLEYRPRHSFAA